jgi:hypothetical protein
MSQLPGRRASISSGLAWARCAASAASTVGIGLASAGPICGTEAAGPLRPPGRAWSRPGAAAARCLISARAILTARMLDKAWGEMTAAVAAQSPRPA